MGNPLDSLEGLKGWQKGAVVIGGAAVGGAALLAYRKKKAAGTTAAAASPAAASAMVTDPSTGQSYPADAVDPVTSLTYGIEIQEYGSVTAADAADSQAGGLYGNGATGGGNGGGDSYDGQQSSGTAGSATNAQWVAEVEAALSQLGYSDTDIQQGLARYFSSSPQGTAADGTSLYSMMDTAIGEFGPPPSGTYALVRGGTAPPGHGSDSVTVPDVTGRTDLDTAEAEIKAAGLVPHAAGDSGRGNTGEVTSQDPKAGSKVTRGSGVTLTYKVHRTSTGHPGSVVRVPELTGLRLDAALAKLKEAGLTNTTAKPVRGVTQTVTAQAPKAGTVVDKGSHVDLTTKKTR